MNFEKFKYYLKNKSIVIVGPSSSLFDEKNGNIIDNYDIVCRIKKSYPLNKKNYEYTGKRTDILITHFKLGNNKYKQNNFDEYNIEIFNKLNYLIFPFPNTVEPFSKFYKNITKIENLKKLKVPIIYKDNENDYYNLKKELDNKDPKTGLMGIDFILSFNIKELFLTGITFEKDGFDKNYKSKNDDKYCKLRTKEIHNSDLEFKYFKKLYKKDKRIKIDTALQKLIENSD